MVYLGNRKDLSDYKNHIEMRIKGMVRDLEPKPEKDKVDFVVKAMVQLILDADLRKQIIMSVNSLCLSRKLFFMAKRINTRNIFR